MADVDVVIIGSGAAGLTAGVALAQAGKKVLILEQHYVAGGWCHSFTLEGYRFSPGVHYLGEMQEGGRFRSILEGLGVSRDLEMLELNPDGYDRVLMAGEEFRYPSGYDQLVGRLQERFPKEGRNIARYLEAVARIGKQLDEISSFKGGLLELASLPFKASTVAWLGLRSLRKVQDKYFRDPLLKGILAAQVGDHGVAPNRVPFAMHAPIQDHYFNGGYYPRGGGFAIPKAFIRALKRAGGDIRLRTRVDHIILEGSGSARRAVGVRLADGEEIRADLVISNADPGVTYDRLVGREHLSRSLRRKLDRLRWSISCLSLFMATDMDLRAAGMDSGNMWYYPTTDIDQHYKDGLQSELDMEKAPAMFLTATTLKDPTKKRKQGHHTLEAFTLISPKLFQRFVGTDFEHRPAEYQQLKERLTRWMLHHLDAIVPGLSERLTFCDLGTPLTNTHYVMASAGNIYGTEKTRDFIGPWAYPVRTEVPGLYHVGASTVAHGVMGAVMGGLSACRSILRCGDDQILTQNGPSLPIYPCDALDQWPEHLQRRIARQEVKVGA